MIWRLLSSLSVLWLLPATSENLIQSVLKNMGVVIQQTLLVFGIRMFDH